jgi:methionyl-tRNA formyltransferase
MNFPRIVFLGTPDFAVASLEALADFGYNIVAVVTAPDKPAGRGLKLSESAVKQFSVSRGLPVLQPLKLKDPAFLKELSDYRADLQVVVAFRMLPEMVWSMPKMGTINLHASLLPQYRGAAPINRVIMNGEHMTGLTTFKLQQEIDTGNILLSEKMPVGEEETAGELHDRMKMAGARLLVKTVEGLVNGSLQEKPQEKMESGILKTAPKLFTEDSEIHWTKPVSVIYNQIRGLSPFPGAFTRFQGKSMKIFRAKKEAAINDKEPGLMETDGKSWIRYSAPDGYIYIDEMQLEGKKRMKTTDFLRGYRPG